MDSRASTYIAAVLAERRDRIVETYLSFGGGLDRLRIQDNYLVFSDLTEAFGHAFDVEQRTARWYDGDQLIGTEESDANRFRIPSARAERVELMTPRMGTTRVYIQGEKVVGVERCGASGFCDSIARRQAAFAAMFAKSR